MSPEHTPPPDGPRRAPRRFSRATSVLFFVVQLGYGTALVIEAVPRRSDPRWMGLGVMGLTFAVAAVLFIAAEFTGARSEASVGRRRLVLGASVLMLAGAASMVVGVVARH